MNLRNSICLALITGAPLLSAAQTWNDVSLVDLNCSAKVKSNPDGHTRDCALQCSKSGFGILLADGSLLKLDVGGNQQAIAALKGSQLTDHLRATVTGDREVDTIKVKSLKM
jgi:hypothetical protein